MGSKLSSLFRRKNTEGAGIAVSAPPEAIAGLYLRETSRNHLAMMLGPPFNAAGSDGARQDVEFGVMLEGDLVSGVDVDDSSEGEGVEGGGSVVDEAGEGESAVPGLVEDEGIEMMELGGEWKRKEGVLLPFAIAAVGLVLLFDRCQF